MKPPRHHPRAHERRAARRLRRGHIMPGSIVCVGDDNAVGDLCDVLRPWPTLLRDSMAGLFTVQNLAQNGATATHFKDKFKATHDSLLKSKASVVVVMLGTNDATATFDGALFTSEMRDLTESLQDMPTVSAKESLIHEPSAEHN